MSVQISIPIIETALWPQGDARDPLGVWGAAANATGDATAGEVSAFIQVQADRRRSRIYTCYDAFTSWIAGPTDTGTAIRARLFAGWPDINVTGGVQGYETMKFLPMASQLGWSTNPIAGAEFPLIDPLQRFILLFDTSVQFANDALTILRIDRNANVNTTLYTFQAYGYYWDRAILSTPGGPRHPGAT